MSSPAIGTTCTTLKLVSKYDFIFGNEKNCLLKNHLHSGLTRINPKTIRIWSKWEKQYLNVTNAREPTYISQIVIKNLFYILKHILPLLPDSLRSRLVKLGSILTRSWEKETQELHGFSRNRDHLYNSQIHIQIWFHLSKSRICIFKNHLHSGSTRIKPKMIRIWLIWEKNASTLRALGNPPISLKSL